MATIYELTGEYREVFEQIASIIDEGGEVDLDTAIKALDLQDNISDKVVNIGKFIKNVEAESAAISSELARLRAKKTANDRKVNALKHAALEAMKLVGLDRVNDPIMPVRLQANSQFSVSVENVAALPDKYKKVVYEADKKALLADKDELDIQGVTITKGQHIRFG